MRREPTEHLGFKKHMLVHLLDEMCRELDLTDSEYADARARYQAVGNWLSESDSPLLQGAVIYPHGSIGLGTAVRPIGHCEFDVDLVNFLLAASSDEQAAVIKRVIGDRLKAHETYRGMLVEKRRCWRLNYAGKFHMDITPSVRNPKCLRGGELVPDKELQRLKPTNPRGYVAKFEQYAALAPRLTLMKGAFAEARGDVRPLPPQQLSKPLLNRIVQLLKRHRDVYFMGRGQTDVMPISIIITTLAAWSYARCATHGQYEDEFEFLLDVVRQMPDFIQLAEKQGRPYYIIPNETTDGENFAERWYEDERLPRAFFAWHQAACEYMASLIQVEGADSIAKSMRDSFSLSAIQTTALSTKFIEGISAARGANTATITRAMGSASSVLPAVGATSTAVRANTFYGR